MTVTWIILIVSAALYVLNNIIALGVRSSRKRIFLCIFNYIYKFTFYLVITIKPLLMLNIDWILLSLSVPLLLLWVVHDCLHSFAINWGSRSRIFLKIFKIIYGCIFYVLLVVTLADEGTIKICTVLTFILLIRFPFCFLTRDLSFSIYRDYNWSDGDKPLHRGRIIFRKILDYAIVIVLLITFWKLLQYA
jgi:hypothetical protein